MAELEKVEEQRQKVRFEAVVINPSIPKFYANGFTLGITPGDMHAILLLNGVPVAAFNSSITNMKSLHKAIGVLLDHYEKKTGKEIGDSEELKNLLGK